MRNLGRGGRTQACKPRQPVLSLLILLALTACNAPLPNSNPQATASSTPQQTVEISTGSSTAETNQTPAEATLAPTSTPLGPTPTPDPDCEKVQFFDDVTYPDNVDVKAGETITKTWRVKNTGTCPWDSSYKLVFIRDEQMESDSPAEIITTPIAPGSMADISIELKVPKENGIHSGVWQIYNSAGIPLKKADGNPQLLTILINVKDGTGGKVNSVRTWSYLYYGVKCTGNVEYDITANIYVDGPMGVAYTWSVSNGVLSIASQSHTFGGAGSLEVTTHISGPFANPNDIKVTLTANGVSASFTICP